MGRRSGFALEQRLAAGGMGEVWRARSADGVPVALKIVREDQAADGRVRALFDTEVRAMARLDHPAISWVYDYGSVPASWAERGGVFSPGAPYVAMELSSGGTLEDRPPRDWPAIREALCTLLDALAHSHARGLIHRDLKPANVLISEAKDVRPGLKLTDFGVAHAIGGSSRKLVAGTPVFMAPEQVGGRPADMGPWTDLYALGCVTWRWVCGRPPYLGANTTDTMRRHVAGVLPNFRPVVEVPDAVEAWVRALLAPAPEDRFRRAADAARALPGSSAAAGVPTVPAPMPEDWRRPQWSSLRLSGAGLGLYALREVPLVGRERERTLLWGLLRRVQAAGRGAVAVVRGVSGVGKTALVRWVAQRAHEVGAVDIVEVACERGDAPHDGFRRLALRALGLLDVPEGARLGALDGALAGIGVRPRHQDVLRALLAGEGPSGRLGRAPALRALCRGRDRTLFLIVDDVQWGAGLLELVRLLQAEQRLRPSPVLVAVLAEDEAVAAEPEVAHGLERIEAAGAVTLRLAPLSDPEQTRLVQELVGLDPGLLARATERSGGNPGFAVALVGHWVAQGRLRATPRGFCLTDRSTLEAPPTLAALWRERVGALLDAVDPPAIVALEVAAVLGDSVDEALWARICDDPEAEWARRGVTAVDATAHRMRHALVERLLVARLAEESEEGFAWSHRMVPEVLVGHARDAGRIVEHHRACAAHLRVRSAPADAYALGTHLLASGEVEAALEPLIDGMRWWLVRGGARRVLVDLRRLHKRIEEIRLVVRPGVMARLGALEAFALHLEGRLDDALTTATEAAELAVLASDREAQAEALVRIADLQSGMQRHDEAEATSRRVLEVMDAARQEHWGGLARLRIARACRGRGDREGMARWCDEAQAVLEPLADRLEAPVLLANVFDLRGDDARTERWARVAWERCEPQGRTLDTVWAAAKLHDVALRRGDLETARQWQLRAIEQATLGSDVRFLCTLRFNLAKIDLVEQRWQAAWDGLTVAFDERRGGALDTALCHAGLAAAAAGMGRWSAHDHHVAALEQLDGVPAGVKDFGEVLAIARQLAERAGWSERAERLPGLAERLVGV